MRYFKQQNAELKLVADWFRENRLTVNFDNTSYIILNRIRKLETASTWVMCVDL